MVASSRDMNRRCKALQPTDSAKCGVLKGDDVNAHRERRVGTHRREALSRIILKGPSVVASALLLVSSDPFPAKAEASTADEDLTSKLFNVDGSLRDDATIETEAKERTLEWKWDATEDKLAINIDGSNAEGTSSGSAVKLMYNLPEKWGSGSSDLYLDRSQGVNLLACKRITVYRAPGKATADRLTKATRIGVAKALDVPIDGCDFLQDLKNADLIGGRTRVAGEDGQKYYEFDMAVAPKTCDTDDEANLGLGFCPYESIYLLSATIVEDRLYVICVESDKMEWKRANADLRRVRSSFQVEIA